jgi:hypothetical protein
MMQRLSLPANTVIAELIGQVRYLESTRKLGSQRGAIARKLIKGTIQYYYRYYDFVGKRRECYIGSDTVETREFIERFCTSVEQYLEEQKKISELARMVVAGGVVVIDRSTFSIIEALANQGIFRSGGVLVGTQAFIALCHVLGINPTGTGMRTHDIDIVREKRVAVASSKTTLSVVDTLERLNMGFVPVPSLNHKSQSTSYRSETGISIDFLVPMIGKYEEGSVPIPAFGVYAQPLRYLDYLIDGTIEAIVTSSSKSIYVVVPDPSRFAFHKLIVASKRSVVDSTKAAKDTTQAGILFEYLLENRPEDLDLAFEDLKIRGKGWVKNFGNGVKKMERESPEIAKRLNEQFLV